MKEKQERGAGYQVDCRSTRLQLVWPQLQSLYPAPISILNPSATATMLKKTILCPDVSKRRPTAYSVLIPSKRWLPWLFSDWLVPVHFDCLTTTIRKTYPANLPCLTARGAAQVHSSHQGSQVKSVPPTFNSVLPNLAVTSHRLDFLLHEGNSTP